MKPPAAPRRLRSRHVPPWSPSWLVYRSLNPPLEAAARQALHELGRRRADGQPLRVLDVGCGEQPWADLFVGQQLIAIDRDTQGARPQLLAEAEALPLAGASVDLVWCSQVLEHVVDADRALHEFARVLRPGGRLVLSVPFFWPLHEEPHDYRRFTRHGLARSLAAAGFGRVDIEHDCDSGTMLAAALAGWLPRRRGAWLLTAPLVLALNLLTAATARWRHDRRSTLNLVAVATR